MPSRIIREDMVSDERLCSLNWEAEVFYRRLFNLVDDYGRYAANPRLLRAYLFPLQLDKVRESHMDRLLAQCQEASLVDLYTVHGGKYLQLLDWPITPRAKSSRYPAKNCVCDYLQTNVCNCLQTKTCTEAPPSPLPPPPCPPDGFLSDSLSFPPYNPPPPSPQPPSESVVFQLQQEGKRAENLEQLEIPGTPNPDDMAMDVLDWLNAEAGRNFRAIGSNRKLILKALKSVNFDVAGVKDMITTKVRQWKKDRKLAEYLRPSTLFGPKFPEYYDTRKTFEKP